MKREKRLTKRERKALAPKRPQAAPTGQHIHCIACGKHLDPSQFQSTPATALLVACQHGSKFASCVECVSMTKQLLDEHDRTGRQVQAAAAWH